MARNNANQQNRLDAVSIVTKAPKLRLTNYDVASKVLKPDQVFLNPFGVVRGENLNFVPGKTEMLFQSIHDGQELFERMIS